jgi:hypothetical protein
LQLLSPRLTRMARLRGRRASPLASGLSPLPARMASAAPGKTPPGACAGLAGGPWRARAWGRRMGWGRRFAFFRDMRSGCRPAGDAVGAASAVRAPGPGAPEPATLTRKRSRAGWLRRPIMGPGRGRGDPSFAGIGAPRRRFPREK